MKFRCDSGILFLFILNVIAADNGREGDPPDGIFTEFLRKFLNYMTLMPKRRVPIFLPILTTALTSVCSYGTRLANHLSKIKKGSFNSKARAYLEYLDENNEHASRFLRAMDVTMTRLEESRFVDYLDHLNEFLLGYKRTIEKETRYIIADVIPNQIISRLSRRDKKLIKQLLDKAIKEYKQGISSERRSDTRDGNIPKYILLFIRKKCANE